MTRRELFEAWVAAERAEMNEQIRLPSDCLPYLSRLMKARQEKFAVVTLAGDHSVIRVRTVSSGLVNRTLVHPREVFSGAIRDNAVGVILAHNHPSGALEPSREDDDLTDRLVKAGEVVGIAVLDHLIVGRCGYFSYLENDRLN